MASLDFNYDLKGVKDMFGLHYERFIFRRLQSFRIIKMICLDFN